MFDDFSTPFEYYLQFYVDEGYSWAEAERLAEADAKRDEDSFRRSHDGWSSAAWAAMESGYEDW